MTDWNREAIRDTDLDTFRDILFSVLNDNMPPQIDFFKNVVNMALETYAEEDEEIRPKAANGQPGGLLDLRSDKTVILMPDLHARRYFLRNVMDYVPKVVISNDETISEQSSLSDEDTDTSTTPVEEEIISEEIQSEDCQPSDSEIDNLQNNISVMDYVPPTEIDPSDSKIETIPETKDIADKLIEQLHNIREDIEQLENNDETTMGDAPLIGEEAKEDSVDTDSQTLSEVEMSINTKTVLELLEENRVTVLCVGDGVHGEASFASRWREAYSEFLDEFDVCPNMDAEIADSFNLMIAVMLLKIRYPHSFHFLKGNHENICNETGGGNYAFAKFANEGQMVLTYFRMKYDLELLALYSDFEKSLPLFAVGWNFLASHAEPASFYDFDHILNYHINEDVILGLTWTDNYQSMPGTIDVMLDYYIPENGDGTYYFGGHRPIKGIYYRINGDRYVQFHNPWLQIIGIINQNEPIDLDRDMIQIANPDESEDHL